MLDPIVTLSWGVFDPPALSLSVAGLTREPGAAWVGDPRTLIRWAGESARANGLRWVTLDGTRPGFRARELDRSARRDLASSLRRAEVGFAGLDLFIPPNDFVDASTQDRAVHAVLSGLELVHDLAEPLASQASRVVSFELPDSVGADVLGTLESAAARAGVQLADHTWPPRAVEGAAAIGTGLDPVRIVEAEDSPGKAAARAGEALVAARLGDRNTAGRCPVGEPSGKLDLTAYAASLATVGLPTVALDLRGLTDPAAAIRSAVAAWDRVFQLPS